MSYWPVAALEGCRGWTLMGRLRGRLNVRPSSVMVALTRLCTLQTPWIRSIWRHTTASVIQTTYRYSTTQTINQLEIFKVVGLQVIQITSVVQVIQLTPVRALNFQNFYHAMHYSAKRIACRLSVRLSVCLWRWLITTTYWKSWKLIARTISPTFSFFVALRSSTYSQGNMEKFWRENVRWTRTSITSGWTESTDSHVILGGGVAVCLLLSAHRAAIFAIAQLSCF